MNWDYELCSKHGVIYALGESGCYKCALVQSGDALESGTILLPPSSLERPLPAPVHDPVNRPAHYDLNPQPLDVIEAWGMGYHLGNVLKYIARWDRKGGVEDLRKARSYLDRFIKLQEDDAS